jgi:hypothetical protein
MAVEFLNVYCKLPQGLTMCLEKDGEVIRVTLPRTSRYIQPHPKFKPTKEEFIVYQHSVTPVAKDFWEAWKKRMGAEYAPLKQGLVFAIEQTKNGDGIARAKDMETVKTGFEQIKPAKEDGISKLNPDQDSPE